MRVQRKSTLITLFLILFLNGCAYLDYSGMDKDNQTTIGGAAATPTTPNN